MARRQVGLFTRAQALRCGFSRGQIARRVAAGQWVLVARRVMAEAGLTITREVRDRAAQLAVPGSVLAGFSAARIWDIAVPDSDPHLIVPNRARTPPGVRVTRTILHRRDVSIFDGAPITSRPRTIVDCLRLLDERLALDLLDRALQKGWITLGELAERTHGLAGRHGAPRLVRLMAQVGAGSRSAAERRLAALLRRAGITGWAANVEIHDGQGLIGVADVALRSARIVIEVDGWAYHVTPEAFQRDRERQNRLVAAGWTVLRFTWRDLVDRPGHVVTTIHRMVAG